MTTTETKTFSSKSNAKRAALAAGLDVATIDFTQVGDRWTFKSTETTADNFEATAEELAAQVGRPTLEVEEPLENIPAFLRKGRPTVTETIENDPKMKDYIAEKRARPDHITGPVLESTRAKAKAAKEPKAPTVAVRKDGLREGSAMAKMVDLVTRKEGATMEELLAATGWKQCRPMLVKSCEKAGVTLRTEKVEGERKVRYFAS